MRTSRILLSSFIVLLFMISAASGAAMNSSPSPSQNSSPVKGPLMPPPPVDFAPLGSKAFAFVSNFETLTLEGWQSIHGSSPTVVTSENYSGEPSLMSSANDGAQIDFANQGFVTGESFLSYQVAMNAQSGSSGFIGLASASKSFVAVVGVLNGKVVAGENLNSLKTVASIPAKSAYPAGWVYIIADLSNSTGKWTMNVFVDQTAKVNKAVSVPNAGSYAGALIETNSSTVYYTNIIVSTFQIANLVSGYNNMQGYGTRVSSEQIVRLLPAYTNLTAVMTLNNFSAPQAGILSFQINTQNKTAATQATCVGFFQLGLSLGSRAGYVDPWYVPAGNCEGYSFPGTPSLQIPNGEQVILSIVYNPKAQQITFTEVYPSIKKTLTETISYTGSDFYGAYTQMEFQPCCNSYPIGDYKLNGSIFGLEITLTTGQTEYLPASIMIPFNLDAPKSWDVHYYVNATAGYNELST